MEVNHTFTPKEVPTDDNSFKPFTGELPSKLQAFAERALARYEKMSPVLREHFKQALVCTNAAVLRTAYTLDRKNNKVVFGNVDEYAEIDATSDPIYQLKHVA